MSVMEMGWKGYEHRHPLPLGTQIWKNWTAVRIMVIDSFGLMIVWICCFRVLFFFSIFSSSPARCQQDIGDGLFGKSATDEQWLTRKHYESILPLFSILCLWSYKKKIVQWANGHWSMKYILTIHLSWVHSNGLCHWVYVGIIHTERRILRVLIRWTVSRDWTVPLIRPLTFWQTSYIKSVPPLSKKNYSQLLCTHIVKHTHIHSSSPLSSSFFPIFSCFPSLSAQGCSFFNKL